MDPLSVAASVVGLLGATAKVSSVLTTFVRGTKDAPKLANDVLQEVSDISACLAQLQAFLLGTRAGSRSRTALIMVEQVVVTLTACVMTFSELEETVESLNDGTPTRIGSRIAWMKKEPVLARLCLRLNSSKQSLILMLTTLTCASVDQATTSVETLTSLVRDLVQNNQDLYSRILNLESSQRTIRPTASLKEAEDEDDVSTIQSPRKASDPTLEEERESTVTAVKEFTFERDLRQSRAYARVMWRDSLMSLQSSTAPSFGWSCLSGLSLANVSNISVISLPIVATELTNAQHYTSPPNREQALNRSSNGFSARAFDIGKRQAFGPLRPTAVRGPHFELRSAIRHYRSQEIPIQGSSLSGKTTIFTHLRALNGHEFTDGEKEDARTTILGNLVSASILVSFRIDDSGIDLGTQAYEVRIHGFRNNFGQA